MTGGQGGGDAGGDRVVAGMNEHQIAYRIRRHLDAAAPLEDKVLARLRLAREGAVAKQRIEAPAAVLAWAGSAAEYFNRPSRYLAQFMLAVALLVSAGFAINQWHLARQAEDIEEVDAAILTGELPFHAYLDKGFDAWLNKN